jgi:hypothetical protein
MKVEFTDINYTGNYQKELSKLVFAIKSCAPLKITTATEVNELGVQCALV